MHIENQIAAEKYRDITSDPRWANKCGWCGITFHSCKVATN